MRLLTDTNVPLDVALQHLGAPASAQLLALCGRQHEAWLAWDSIATLASLIERQQLAHGLRGAIRHHPQRARLQELAGARVEPRGVSAPPFISC